MLTISYDPIMNAMAKNMKSKFDEYWGEVNKMNKVLFITFVLDPYFKLNFLSFVL